MDTQGQHVFRELAYFVPVTLVSRSFHLVKYAFNAPLYTLTGHDGEMIVSESQFVHGSALVPWTMPPCGA